jgi:hypothetical protein
MTPPRARLPRVRALPRTFRSKDEEGLGSIIERELKRLGGDSVGFGNDGGSPRSRHLGNYEPRGRGDFAKGPHGEGSSHLRTSSTWTFDSTSTMDRPTTKRSPFLPWSYAG